MAGNPSKTYLEKILHPLNIHFNGTNPWDIQVHNENFYSRVMAEGTLGLGESYMDGWWDCEHLDQLFDRALRANIDQRLPNPLSVIAINLFAKIFNFQTKTRSKEVAHQHYNLDSKLFDVMLDKNKIYSCAYFKNTESLDEAQIAKLELTCQKLQLKPGMRLLDIGSGWGGLAYYAAENYGVSVVGVTISEEQWAWAKEHNSHPNIEYRLQDYRDIHETFDRIVSIGMFEHVGALNYPTYMQKVHELLKEKGIFLLHSIGVTKPKSLTDPWFHRYIFPNAALPSPAEIISTAEPFFILEDWQNFGGYYDKTLMAWYENFVNHWPELKDIFDERFHRMWTYYLLTSAAGFRSRSLQLWQVVFSKGGVDGVYIAPR